MSLSLFPPAPTPHAPRPSPTGAPETRTEEVEGPGRKSRQSCLHSRASGHLEIVRSPPYTQTTSAFLLTRTLQLQPSGSWLSQNQARVLGKTLKLLTSPHLTCSLLLRTRLLLLFVVIARYALTSEKTLLQRLPELLLGEVAPPAWIPGRHYQAAFLGR